MILEQFSIFMLAICLVCIAVIFVGLQKALQKTGWDKKKQRSLLTTTFIISLVWLLVQALLANAGFFKVFSLPPRIPLIVLIPVVVVLMLSFTKKFIALLKVIPPHWLLLFQSFRIVVEFWLWQAFAKGLIPVQMTFEGRNFDIISGILGIVAGWMIMKRGNGWKTITVVYNIIGLALLLNIVIVAVLSFPGPTRYFMNEPANAIVSEFPFIFLPGVLVVIAFIFHIIALRQVAVVEK